MKTDYLADEFADKCARQPFSWEPVEFMRKIHAQRVMEPVPPVEDEPEEESTYPEDGFYEFEQELEEAYA